MDKLTFKEWSILADLETIAPLVEDFEFSMARGELKTAQAAITRLMTKLKGEGDLEAWVQSKITKAAEYLDTVADHLSHGEDDTERKKEVKEAFKSYKSVEEISKKHKVSEEEIEKQLEMGMKVEKEHTTDSQVAKEIALQHLDELPNYYSKLKKVEKVKEDWSEKYKKSIDCDNPKGFSQRAHCQGRKKKIEEKCWDGYKQLGMKKKGKKVVPNCVKEDLIDENKSGDSSLRDWFTKSRASDGTPGWVQLGGKYAGKPCAKQPGQTTKPKCGSSKMKADLSDKEEERAFRRKNQEDPNPDREGKAKMVATEEKDACYSKVKSRYKVWPSAYASGALVKCRKVGAANWGNKVQKEELSTKFNFRYGSTPAKSTDASVSSAVNKSLVEPKTFHSASSETGKTGVTGSGSISYSGAPGKSNTPSPTPSSNSNVNPEQKVKPEIKNKELSSKLGKFTKESYKFSNWRDDFKATEYESFNIVEPTPLKESEEIRYCPKCKKNEKKRECRYGEKYWTMFSLPASLGGGGAYDPNEVHPANENVSFEIGGGHRQAQRTAKIRNLAKGTTNAGEKAAAMKKLSGPSLPLADSVIQPGQLRTEDYQRLQSTGNVYTILFSWRGRSMMSLQLFFPNMKRPSKDEVKKEIEKFYPGAVIMQWYPSPTDPSKPIVVIQGK